MALGTYREAIMQSISSHTAMVHLSTVSTARGSRSSWGLPYNARCATIVEAKVIRQKHVLPRGLQDGDKAHDADELD